MLPSILKPKKNYKMIRVGSENDGGYLVEIESLKKSNILISMGLYNNWDFEKGFLKVSKNLENIYSYDDIMGTKFLIKKFITDLISKPSTSYLFRLIKNFYNIFDFNIFLRNTKIHFNKTYFSSPEACEDVSSVIFLSLK